MKKLYPAFIIPAAGILAACNQPAKTADKVATKTWDYVITSQTSRQTLDSLSSTWSKDSINLKFSKVEMDSLGKLSKIVGSVDITSKGQLVSGTFSRDSLNQKAFEIKLDNRPGLYIGDKK
jgi:hypothetical protein